MAGKPLLGGVSFKLERRERLTIAGRNGAGKTTLLRMIAGEEPIDRGELSVAKGVRIALHDQRPPRERTMSLRDYVLSGCVQELEVERELAKLEREMTEGASDDSLLDRYARAQARLESYGGYLWRDRATVMTHGLGFSDADLDRGLDTFSGGQLTRASLARALATSADVLLLDEPTNHLDIESLEWLEQTLVELDAAVMLVAHDRWFLEAVGTAVLELYGARAGGPSSLALLRRHMAHVAARAGRPRDSAGQGDRQAAGRDRAHGALRRALPRQGHQGAPSPVARQAAGQDRAHRARPAERDHARVLLQGARAQRPRDLRAAGWPRPDRGRRSRGGPLVLLDDAELWLERGEHVSLVGANGAGKTTLIETLAGRRPLGAGKLSTGHNVTVGYLSQHAEELGAGGAPGQSVVEAAQRATGLTPNKARALVGRFLFSGEDAEKPLEGLSGGERRRLSLAILMNGTPRPPNVLILDEPTNHLDLESREALEDALRSFDGALLLVSHDRALLDAVGTRTVAIEDGSLRSFLGGWPEYVRVREERLASGVQTPKPQAAQAQSEKANAASKASPSRPSRTPSRLVRPRIVYASKTGLSWLSNRPRRRCKALEDELADPAAWATKYEAAKSEARHTAAKRAVEQPMSA